MPNYKITVNGIELLLRYLVERPYKEVSGLVEMLTKLERLDDGKKDDPQDGGLRSAKSE
jgi:hypothetical protein